jgi:hypothetical protein
MIAREAYKAATGAYPGNLAPLPKAPALPRTMDEAQAVARATHPSIRQAQHQVTVADLQVDLAKANRAPTIGLGATLRTDDEDLQSQSLGLTMNQTLYAGGRLSSLQRRALAGKDAARAGLQQTAVGVVQNVGVAWARSKPPIFRSARRRRPSTACARKRPQAPARRLTCWTPSRSFWTPAMPVLRPRRSATSPSTRSWRRWVF